MDSNSKESAVMKTYKRDRNVQFVKRLPWIDLAVHLVNWRKVILAVKHVII